MAFEKICEKYQQICFVKDRIPQLKIIFNQNLGFYRKQKKSQLNQGARGFAYLNNSCCISFNILKYENLLKHCKTHNNSHIFLNLIRKYNI